MAKNRSEPIAFFLFKIEIKVEYQIFKRVKNKIKYYSEWKTFK